MTIPLRIVCVAALSACAALAAAPGFTATAATGRAPVVLALQTGEVQVLAIPDVARVAVGDGHVINAVTTDEKEVIVFARNEGLSSLQIWTTNGSRRQYHVQVAPEGAHKVQQELRTVLQRIPNARLSSVGDKLLVEGDELSDDDIDRIADLAKRYPQLVDLTGRVGWDHMVLLDVQVVELPRSRLHELGLRWGSSSTGGVTTGLAWETGSSRVLERPAETVLATAFPATVAAGYFGVNALLSAQLQAMAQNGSAVVLAQPQLLARSGATAEFLAGGEVPYATKDDNGNTSTEFKPYGVSLRITPQVERNGVVRSRIEVEVSSVDTSVGQTANGPALKTRRAATEFNVRSGQTLVLAGFLSREASRTVDHVPILGDIPLIGELFTSRRHERRDTELAIFVTPVVVQPDHPDLQRRVHESGAVLAKHFPGPPVINSPVRHVPLLPDALGRARTRDQVAPARDPWSGPTSQWKQDACNDAC